MGGGWESWECVRAVDYEDAGKQIMESSSWGIVSACCIYRGQLDDTSHTLPVETATIAFEDQNLEAGMQSIWGCFSGFTNLIRAVLEQFLDKWGQHVFIPSYFILSAWKCPVKARHSYSVFLETLWSKVIRTRWTLNSSDRERGCKTSVAFAGLIS